MKCISPIYVNKNVVPCGKCNYCKQLRMLDWSFRLRNEMRYSHTAYFVTLTLRFAPQLGVWPRHLNLFFKRLRYYNRQRYGKEARKISYYAVAEYGKRTLRPHYHAIIFNANEDDIVGAWKLGHVHCGTVTPESIAYCANYSLKGSRYPKGSRRPFSRMSRRPAIGEQYLTTHRLWHRNGHAHTSHNKEVVESFKIHTNEYGVKGHLPRFYRDRLFSKVEREILNRKNLEVMEEQYGKEVQRLKALGHKEPENYMLERAFYHHEQLVTKFEKNETI